MKFICKPAGDQAVLVEFENKIDQETNAMVRQLAYLAEKESDVGMGEVILGYRSLLIHYNPVKLSYVEVQEKLQGWGKDASAAGSSGGREVHIPVLYGGERGPDLKDVAEHNALSPEEVISIHSGGEYLVYFLGFTPGYPFMGGMSEKISTPRLPSPRVSIPAGSVGIANNQTGIYPVQSPGGWRLIGCTPMRLYDPEKENPFLLESGDKVFFEEITEEEFEEIEKNNETWNIHSSQRIKG
ncbi:allophanate hydrolase [Siminovitchia terrae]|uniref:5-oxoprolinase subunit PxpB n=1 Tax=Siminovitchia terrae TaxID=1914933 RepID=A0A429X7U4_SIMTE|nr:5-oxoprolinase subunit PxpB [Siminovitchia terrae]RST59390.1 5-oxoprolinase subunit PxpB [Siminovitchia terrae]GIN92884.1 allophanate hydrolase [Siminovitchia terrae]GIN97488.1 allophanate hydrolase [Siminovitchia terrae]